MKKIYMILAAMTLLTMSLNAQRLPAKNLGEYNFNPTGMAYKYMPKGQFRMPTLGSGEYLLGPYTTDAFDATGISYGGYYSSAQEVTAMVELSREEFESHIGDTIIGFRFALAGSTTTRVYDFMAWPASENYWDQGNSHTWELGTLMGHNTTTQSETETVVAPVDVTFTGEYNANNYVRTKTINNVTVNLGSSGQFDESNDFVIVYGTTNISTTDGTITKIVFNGYSTRYPVTRISLASGSTGSYTTSNNVGTWTGNATSVSFTNNQAARCSSIVVTVERETTVTTSNHTVEVGRGASKNEDLPVSGFNQDYGYHNQMIYRAGQLAMANGAQIKSMTFYPEPGTGLPFSGSTVTVRLANTTRDNFGTGTTANKITTGLSTVATITPVANSGATEWKIEFDTPFEYSGGNLLVQMSCTGGGQWAHTNFLGDAQSANVSLVSAGNNYSTTSGTTSTFLPKATFTFTGDTNTNTYLDLAGGEWHDFFLDEPVVFAAGDSIQMLAIGYTYWQLASTSHAPSAVNSNSTGHQHRSYMATNSYSARWWDDGISGSDNTDRPGDLAVQLIFKQAKQKTPAPTITYQEDAQYGHVTATATDPNATVTLTVGGQTATGIGSVTVNIGRGDSDVTVTATATAQDPDKLVSDPTTETYVVHESALTPTPAPTITPQTLDLTVKVTGSGEGEVHMYINGQEVANPEYLERGTTAYTVTVTVTAMINDGDHRMTTTTQQVVVPPLDNLEEIIDGWIELPGTYTNNSVINWNNSLMFVDRFSVSTATNNHPTEYNYVMTEDSIKLVGTPRKTNEHLIPVQTTHSQVNGFYTELDVLADRDRQHVDTCVFNADIQMTLDQSGEIYYYTLERSRNTIMDEDFLELSYLQNDGARYVEMDEYFTWQEPFHYGPMNRFDTINTMLPATAPQGVDGKHYGKYGIDYLAYVPIVWTHGNSLTNKRLNFDNDKLNNSYGSPIWKTAVGKVEVVGAPKLERQQGESGSTNWTEINGNDTTKCSIFMVKDIEVNGFLPDRNVTNIKYEPYMFRVWVVSKRNNLREFEWVPGEEGRPGSHFEGRGVIPANTPYMIWEEFVADSSQYITFPTTDVTHFHKWKEENPENLADTIWLVPEDMNMIFAGQNDIAAEDIKILVRFYYRSTGEGLYQNAQTGGSSTMFMRNRGPENQYYGVENPGGGDPNPEIPTYINNVYDYTQARGEVVDVTYFNLQGMKSSVPFDGINIVVTRYSNGSVSSTKVLR